MTKTTGLCRTVGTALIGVSVFALGACSPRGAPAQSEFDVKLVDGLQTNYGFTDKEAAAAADCVAPRMVHRLSDDALIEIHSYFDQDSSEWDISLGDRVEYEAIVEECQECLPPDY